MRIAYVCPDPGVPAFGHKGASVHLRELTRALAALGHDVVVLVARPGGPRPAGFGVPVEHLSLDPADDTVIGRLRRDPAVGRAPARDVRALLSDVVVRERGRRVLERFAPDVIYARHALFGTSARSLADGLGIPLVVEVNAPLAEEHARYRGLAFVDAAREVERRVLLAADRVVAVSTRLARWLVAIGVAPERIAVLPNAVDPSLFDGRKDDRPSMRAALGIGDRPVVGFLGTLKPWHDVGTLVDALAALGGPLRPRLLVIGDGPERAKLEAAAGHVGIADDVTITGPVAHEAVPSYLAAVDVTVAPYAREDDFYFSPLKLFESLAAARPVVAARVGDIPHCIRPRVGGALYEPGDAAGLAAALESLLRAPERTASLAAAGRQHVLDHHTWRANAEAVAAMAQSAGAPG